MKNAALLAFVCCLAHGQNGKPDLGGNGVWVPGRIADLFAKHDLSSLLLPAAKARFEQNRANPSADPATRCLPPGIPRMAYTPSAFQILQLSNRIVFMYEGGGHVWRNVWMDGRSHPKDPNPNWLGDAIGHWEGNSLIVDSVGFNDKTWLDEAGHPHSERLHVIEKYTRSSASAMQLDVVIDDPGAYTQSWTFSTTIPFRPGRRLQEYLCEDVGQSILSPAK